ncbi:MAG: HlyD family efflux transporter periplasmic adaptor subunit [Algicola sp.]|nr:HlyD family efflux transporter periplasmic adaptor subunit [Algicola sp.]
MIQGTGGQDEQIAKPSRKKWRKHLIAVASVIVVAGFSMPTLSQWYNGIPSVEQQSVLTAKVFIGELVRDIAVSGKLVAANAPTLYSPEPGKITLLAKPGAQVAKDSIVARVESPELKALISQQSSALEQLKIEAQRGELINSEAQLDLEKTLDGAVVKLTAAKREHQRATLSFKTHLISELDFVQTKDVLQEAQLAHKHAQKRVELAKKRLAFESQTREFSVKRQILILTELERRQHELDIRAPVAGIVGSWLVKQKEQVGDAQALMSVVDLSAYEAELNVPEFNAGDLGLGLQVVITLAGKQLNGQINSISPEVVNNQVKVRVSISAENLTSMRQNQRLNARIEFERKNNVLMVKRGAFLKSAAGKSAFVVNDNIAKRTPIQTGSLSVEYVELTSGVRAGDTLIISDYQDFKNNEQVLLTQ